MSDEVVTLGAGHLFIVNEDCKKLDNETAQQFHTLVAKLLFICKSTRPDIQVAIAFLTSRVEGLDDNDWKKLGRVIKYLHHTAKVMLMVS